MSVEQSRTEKAHLALTILLILAGIVGIVLGSDAGPALIGVGAVSSGVGVLYWPYKRKQELTET